MNIRFCFLYYVVTCLLICLVAGCGSDEDMEPTNNSPIVDVLVVPKEFSLGDVVEFRVLASDIEGDSLTFKWEVDGGELIETTGTKVKWKATEDVESVKVTVIVSDGVSDSTKRAKRIHNRNFIHPEPIEKPFDPNPDPPLNSIVPGVGAAGIKFGDPFKKVETLYGKADNPLGVTRFFSYWDENKGFSGFVDANYLVTDLFIDRPNKAKTEGKNGIGSRLERVEEEFGPAQEIDNDNVDRKNHWYWKLGIKFAYDAENKVIDIYIFNRIGAAPPGRMMPFEQNPNFKKALLKNLELRLKQQKLQ